MAVVGEITFTVTAIAPPGADAMKEYSPSPRHVADGVVHGVVVPTVKRGSNAHAPPGATAAGEVRVCAAPPPSGVNATLGVVGAVPTFWTTIVETRLTAFDSTSVPAFLAAYGPYTVAAPAVIPSVA